MAEPGVALLMAVSAALLSYLQGLGLTQQQIDALLASATADGPLDDNAIAAAAARYASALASGALTTPPAAPPTSPTPAPSPAAPSVGEGVPSLPPAGPGAAPMMFPDSPGAPMQPVGNPGGGYDVTANPYGLFNPSAITAAGSPSNPPPLTAPSRDTVGLLNQYAYAVKNGIGLFGYDPEHARNQFVQLVASVLGSGSTYYAGNTLDEPTVALARQVNAGNRYALYPEFAQALETGMPSAVRSVGIASGGRDPNGMFGAPMVDPLPGGAPGEMMARPAGPQPPWTPGSTRSTSPGITDQSDITALQGYIRNLTGVKGQEAKLAGYQSRLTEYQGRIAGSAPMATPQGNVAPYTAPPVPGQYGGAGNVPAAMPTPGVTPGATSTPGHALSQVQTTTGATNAAGQQFTAPPAGFIATNQKYVANISAVPVAQRTAAQNASLAAAQAKLKPYGY